MHQSKAIKLQQFQTLLFRPLRFSALAAIDMSDIARPEQLSIDDWGIFDKDGRAINNDWLDEKIAYLNEKKTQVGKLVTCLKSVIKVS